VRFATALGELFNVDLNVDERAGIHANSSVANPAKTPDQDLSGDDETRYVLPVLEYYALDQAVSRRAKWLQARRTGGDLRFATGIKFSIMRRRTRKFQREQADTERSRSAACSTKSSNNSSTYR